MGEYVPELGQAIFGNPTGQYEMSDPACGLLEWVMLEIKRVYWNTRQKEWDRYDDPKIPGVIYRPYYWGDEESPEAALPNFQLEGDPLEIRWYKHSWRGQSCNLDYTPEQWFAWCQKAMDRVRQADIRDY